MKAKIGMVLAVAALGTFTALAAAVWACTPSRFIALSPTFGAEPQRAVEVSGKGFLQGIPVEIRWNTVKGPVLGQAESPDFSVPVTIPAVAKPDSYFVVAVQRDASDSIVSKASAVIEVQPFDSLGPEASLGNLWGGFESGRQFSVGQVDDEQDESFSPQLGAGMALVALALAGASAVGYMKVRRRSAQRVDGLR